MAMDKEQRDRIQRASTYKNTKVKNAAGEKVGKVEDIMLNTATGEISYVVLAVDTGFLNMDSKYFAVPWQALKFDTAQEDVFILNVEKEKLKNAPGFDKDNWPDDPQHGFLTEVHNYYGFSRATEPNPPLGKRDTGTIRDRDDTRDPNPKQTNFI